MSSAAVDTSGVTGRYLAEGRCPSQSKPQVSSLRRASQSITEYSGLPGTCKSNAGFDCTDEPWTNRSGPFGALSVLLRQMNRRIFSPSACLVVQCSLPVTRRFSEREFFEKKRAEPPPPTPPKTTPRPPPLSPP